MPVAGCSAANAAHAFGVYDWVRYRIVPMKRVGNSVFLPLALVPVASLAFALAAAEPANTADAPAVPPPTTRAQPSASSVPDPKTCVVVLEEMGRVGFRIADAQAVAESILRALRPRVGRDGIVYAGVAKSQAELQRMLGKGVETPEIQQQKLDYFKAAEGNASWLLRARFGIDKKAIKAQRHWITVSCRKKGAAPESPSAGKKGR
jgi:hypothetical protein